MISLPDEKSGLSPTGPARSAAVVLAVLAGLAVPCHADPWKIEARGLVTVQTTLAGEDGTRGKFRPGLRAEVLAPVVIGAEKPRALGQVVARIGVLDFPDPSTGAAAGANPAATISLALERQIGRAKLAGAEPAQRVATALGVEAGFASHLGTGKGGKWAGLVARLSEERDGLELRLVGGVVELAGKSQPGVIVGLSVPIRRAGAWIVLGSDATIVRDGGQTVQVYIGGGIR